MTVKTGTAWAGTFVTLDSTGALATPSSGPAGVLYVDGAANGATVTITGSNPYKWAVTLPSLTAGQRVDIYITATIATIATAGFVASEQADTALISEVKAETAAILEDTGTTIPGTITTIDNEIAVIDGIVDAILVDTGTTLDGKLDTIDGIVDSILVDTGTDIPAALTTIDNFLDTEVAAILEDTGTTLPATLATIEGKIDTVDNFLDTEVAAILEDTGTTLPASLTAIQADLDNPDQYKADVSALATAAALATVDGIVDSILVDTDVTIPGLIAALNNLSAAQVNAEVVDALQTDTIPDSYSVDGAQPTISQAILAIHQFLYERAVSGTTMTVYKPNGTTVAITLTLDDATSPTSYSRSA